MTIVLIDGDLVVYRCSASAQNEEFWVAQSRADSLLDRICLETGADSYEFYLTGSDNFRYKIDPNYKANRTQERPKHLESLREYFLLNKEGKITYGYETDDALSLRAGELGDVAIIASLDKDLRQVPGRHYSWEISGTSVNGKEWVRPMEIVDVSPTEGLRSFYTNLLIGDRSDNILGVEGIGKVKAAKWLEHCSTELEMFDTVQTLYEDDARLLKNGQLMWLLRQEGEIWKFPDGHQPGCTASL